jgi:ABC-type sugar transport system ATPase subunit
VRVEGLSVRGVLSNISFSLHAGEVLGISGLLGAGRTSSRASSPAPIDSTKGGCSSTAR